MTMLATAPVNWTDPTTWPWIIWVWMAMVLVGSIKPVWRWFLRTKSQSWPLAEGRIENIDVKQGGGRRPFVARVAYSYSVAGTPEAGWYVREFLSDQAARGFLRGLKGQRIAVHYSANKPSRSWLSEPSLNMLLENRPPAPAMDSSGSTPASLWSRAILQVLSLLALAGLVLSLWVHLGALLGKRVAPDYFFWSLHIGIFVVWFPTIFVCITTMRNVSRKDFWKIALKDAPEWMRYMVYFFFAYAFVNFALFLINTPPSDTGSTPPAAVWRGFSGHWMLFYSAAFAILYSAAHSGQPLRRCLNGHDVPAHVDYCKRCGQPVLRSI